jgi:hypothetical protein
MTQPAAQSLSKTAASQAIDAELKLFSRFRDSPDIEKEHVNVWYGMALGAALISGEMRSAAMGEDAGRGCQAASRLPNSSGTVRPLRFTAAIGAIGTGQEDRIHRVLDQRFGIEGIATGDSPLSRIIAAIELYEDYVAMVESRAAIATAAQSGSPTALLSCLEAQAANLRKHIRNFQDGSSQKKEEAVSW